jgi:hypothetical protein
VHPFSLRQDSCHVDATFRCGLPWLADFVANDATDYGSGRRSKNATAKRRTSNAAYANTNCGIFVLRAHPGTTAQTDQNCCGNGAH